jgi:hypothetical protein
VIRCPICGARYCDWFEGRATNDHVEDLAEDYRETEER